MKTKYWRLVLAAIVGLVLIAILLDRAVPALNSWAVTAPGVAEVVRFLGRTAVAIALALSIAAISLVAVRSGRAVQLQAWGMVALSGVLGLLVATLVKNIGRLRPVEAKEGIVELLSYGSPYGLPSTTAALFFALAFCAFFNARRGIPLRAGWALIVVALLTSASRVLAGIHWPTDILAGAAVGLGAVLLVQYAEQRCLKRRA